MLYIIGTCNFIRMLVWLERNNLMEKCQENDQRLSKQWGTLQLICKIVCGGQILFALAWLFVWSNPWIMKNKCHHQCWAEVQLTWFLYNTFAIIYPSHIIPNSKGLFYWFLMQLQEPPSTYLWPLPTITCRYNCVFGPHCNPPAETRPKCSQGIFLMRPSYAQS